ncbi:MAG TPA: RDD family protein [Vicinamibacterales bacterium]|nr:RDD family protein [Vicinamibacterales bacterium]
MRCPKCQYISFDNGDKCRNCGYEFSLSVDPGAVDMDIQPDDDAVDLRPDFSSEDLETAAPAPVRPPAPPATSPFDLPLFRDRAIDDDAPLVSAPAVPRAPLSVRKGAPVVARPGGRRGMPQEPQLDLEPGDRSTVPISRPASHPSPHAPSHAVPVDTTAAPAGARLLAGIVDLTLLVVIDAAVLHFTLKLCGLTYAEIGVLPVAPFLAFLLLLNGTYLTAFTAAGGQSIGKMLGGIRVVPSDPDAWTDRVPLGQAVLRAAAYFASALPLGLGFLPALIGADKRAIHDRLAHTRVVKA